VLVNCVRQLIVVFFVAAVALWPARTAFASDDGDFEYWAKADVRVPVGEQWYFSFEHRLTFGDEARRLDDQQTDLAFTYTGLADWFRVGIGYKHMVERDGDRWRPERRPLLNLTARGDLFGLDVASRSRFEYRDREGREEVWRYRNLVTIAPPVTFTALKIRPYVADEIFVNFDEKGFNQQRLYGGIFIPLHKRVRLELFYLWKLDREPEVWHDTNVLGSYLHFLF
jgi:hypothetical protein